MQLFCRSIPASVRLPPQAQRPAPAHPAMALLPAGGHRGHESARGPSRLRQSATPPPPYCMRSCARVAQTSANGGLRLMSCAMHACAGAGRVSAPLSRVRRRPGQVLRRRAQCKRARRAVRAQPGALRTRRRRTPQATNQACSAQTWMASRAGGTSYLASRCAGERGPPGGAAHAPFRARLHPEPRLDLRGRPPGPRPAAFFFLGLPENPIPTLCWGRAHACAGATSARRVGRQLQRLLLQRHRLKPQA